MTDTTGNGNGNRNTGNREREHGNRESSLYFAVQHSALADVHHYSTMRTDIVGGPSSD